MNRIDFQVTLPLATRLKDGVFVAVCPPLDVVTQGLTQEEAETNLREAVGLFLSSCFDRGVLTQVLLESGFSRVDDAEPAEVDDAEPAEQRSFVVNLPFVSQQCRA